uniref:Zgc:112982 n=2 Tax=Nothobranchius rachovii TaxID=451742 RepID=A0A1A8S5A1_9TELE
MSRPRSRSPRHRRFPWEELDFDPCKVIEEMDGRPRDRSHRLREGPEELGDFLVEKMYLEDQRRSPFSDESRFRSQRHSGQELYRRGPSPHRDQMHLENRRDGEGSGNDRRREDFQRFGNRGAFRQSPQPLLRLGPLDPPKGAGMGWRPEQRGRGRGRFRDSSVRSGDQRTGDVERERREGSFRGRQREKPHHEQDPPFKRPRREMDDASRFGYGNEEDFGDRGFSANRPRGGFGGRSRGNFPRRDSGNPGFGTERDRGLGHRQDFRRHESDFEPRRSPRSVGSSQERFRTSAGRLDGWEISPERHFRDDSIEANRHETRRSPNPQRYDGQEGQMNHRGRGRFSQGRGGRMEPPRNQPRFQDLPDGEQREGYRAFRGGFEDPVEKKPNWENEDRRQRWEDDRPGSLQQSSARVDLDHKIPHQRERDWSSQKSNDVTIITEETLTVKVDMSRPANHRSPLCYSSDRQLSFDLVNVGRQRLDFLPMLEHSGTYRENASHTGTFAQEIITLVHFVKEQYFKGAGPTLDKRFSAPQKGGYSEDEVEELTLNQRFSSNRGFRLNADSLFNDDDEDEDDETLFSRLRSMQSVTKLPLRGPGDLRHNLERRRQEKLEAVRVTIPGSSSSQQRSRGNVSEPDETDQEGFSHRSQNPHRQEGTLGPRRGASVRPNMGPQRWNHRFGPGRQNHPAGLN